MYQDVTVAFSGHNLKWFATLAIESFLLHYPDMRENIVYFDDESTDGTREELESRGIRVISWLDEFKEKYLNIDGLHATCLTIRVSFIYRCIMEQVHTKYLLMCDGDIVYKNGGVLEHLFEFINQGYKIVSPIGSFFYNEKCYQHMLKKPEIYGLYTKYVHPVTEEELRVEYNDEEIEKFKFKYHIQRVLLVQTLMDLDYFKSIGILGDDIENIIPPRELAYVDTSVNFTCRLREEGIDIAMLQRSFVESVIFHWGWLASANRDPHSRADTDFLKHMDNALYKVDNIQAIARKVNIHPLRLIRSFEKSKGQSKIIGLGTGK